MSKETMIPRVRFESFKENFIKYKLKDIGIVESCRRIYKKETTDEGEIPFYKIGTFGKEADSFINKETFEKYKNDFSYPEIGNVLLSASGTLGRTVVYKGEEAYFQDSNIVWLNHDNTLITDNFLLHFYQSTSWNTVEGSTIKRLYNKDILAKEIYLPSIEEQEKFSNLFEKLDQAISLQQQVVDVTKEYKQSMLQKMFPKKGEEEPEIRFEGFTNKWDKIKLQDTIELEFKGKTKESDLNPGNTEYLNTERLNGGEPFMSDAKQDVDAADVLILWDGSKAGMVYSGFNGALGSTLKCYKINNQSFNSEFIYQNLKKNQEKIYNQYRTPNIPHVVRDFTKVYKILIPSLEEQQKIGSFFKTLDEKIEQEEQKLETYQSMKKALMQRMFV